MGPTQASAVLWVVWVKAAAYQLFAVQRVVVCVRGRLHTPRLGTDWIPSEHAVPEDRAVPVPVASAGCGPSQAFGLAFMVVAPAS